MSANGHHPPTAGAHRVGLVDGSQPAGTRRFTAVLDEGRRLQLDELVVTRQPAGDGTELAHYGIVVEASGALEGATYPTDTQRIADETMPGVRVERVEVQVLRTVPELWLPPMPGAEVARAVGPDRDRALFVDQMDRRELPVGLDLAGGVVSLDFAFLNGEQGAHVSISGISGVATKTSYATFLLYMLFETDRGRELLGAHRGRTRAVVFNVKGEDLLHLDLPNARFPREDRQGQAERTDAADWRALGVDRPGPFTDVALLAPRAPGGDHSEIVTSVRSRGQDEVRAFGWTPWEFIRRGLLRFCFTEDGDRSQVAFIEQRVRTQLLRHAHPLRRGQGAVVMIPPEHGVGFDFARVARQAAARAERDPGEGAVVRDFADLVDYLTAQLVGEDGDSPDPHWTGSTQGNTVMAFLRRLYAASPRLGHLVVPGVQPPDPAGAGEGDGGGRVTVVDLHDLHEQAQRFVVGAVLERMLEQKQGAGREPLHFVVLDELNKYAPRQGQSPIRDLLVDIASRGRSLGLILIGAQQSAIDVAEDLPRNASIKVAGRLDAGEAGEYRFLTPELRERATRFLPGTMVVDQPIVPAPIPVRFPFPPFATNVAEGAGARRREPIADPEAAERELRDLLR